MSNRSVSIMREETDGSTIASKITKQFLVKDGSCTTCEAKVHAANTIECNSCGGIFHAACQKVEKADKICTETLLRNYSMNSTKANFMWYCDTCLTIYEHDKKCGIQEKLNSLLLKFEIMCNSMSSVKDEVAANSQAITSLVNQGKQVQDSSQKVPSVNYPSLLIRCDKEGVSPDLSQTQDITVSYGIPTA